MALIENLQRKDVDDIDVAEGLKKLYDMRSSTSSGTMTVNQFGESVASIIGLNPEQVRRYLSLVNLAPEVKEMVSEGKITIESGGVL